MKSLPRYSCNPPFSGEYCIYIDRHKHRVCIRIFDSENNRFALHYARYLMCVKEGRILEPNEHVHHKDGNKLNDSIDNLQIMDIKDHGRFHNPKGREIIELKCNQCGCSFQRLAKLHKTNLRKKSLVYCSRSCKASSENKNRIKAIKLNIKIRIIQTI